MGNKKQNRLLMAIIGIALVVVIVLFSVINQNDQNQSPGVAADAKNGRDNATLRVTLQSAKDSYDAGEALFVDVRSEAQYIASHVKGAVLIPLTEIEGNEPDGPKDALIFTYCT